MRQPGRLLAVAVAGVLISALVLYAVWVGSPAQRLAPQPGPSPGGNGTQTVNGLTYATKDVTLASPSGGENWTSAIPVVFENVTFSLWTTGFPSGGGVLLEGTALEPSAAWVGFAFQPTPGADRWFAPDGVFGVGNMSVSANAMTVRLFVAKPMLVYAYLGEQVEYPSPNGTPVTQTFVLDGATFNLSLQHMTLGGPWLVGSARVANGTEYAINMTSGAVPPIACSISDGMPDYWAGAVCREWSSTPRSVGILWDGSSGVGLLVLVTSTT